jgi:drug/metabolite transporter (DMT)-like permease
MGSAISFAIYGVINRPLVKRYPTPTYTAYTILAGAIPLLLVSLPAAVSQDVRL